jgi:hypothetical protein
MVIELWPRLGHQMAVTHDLHVRGIRCPLATREPHRGRTSNSMNRWCWSNDAARTIAVVDIKCVVALFTSIRRALTPSPQQTGPVGQCAWKTFPTTTSEIPGRVVTWTTTSGQCDWCHLI